MKKINIQKIIEKYNVPEIKISKTYMDGGIEALWPRFERAVMNQLESNPNSISRYAIWANTVRDNILESIKFAKEGNTDKSNVFLTKAINSLSAFAEVQSLFAHED
ncbi:MAG: hypothetical protein AB1394_17135 [Bacteroidota bacterium]